MPRDLDDSYGLPPGSSREEKPAPQLPYAPADPVSCRPRIGLIGCGGITHSASAGVPGTPVTTWPCSATARRERPAKRRRSSTPTRRYAPITATSFRRDDIEVVDLAAHPADRAPMYGPAIDAGKHILSQKPFVTDIDFGLRVVDQAEKKGVRIAVNQNGRWAPHWSWIRQAMAAGLLGQVTSVRTAVNWDHNWVAGSVFESIHSLILYDFGIHWFDIVSCFMEPLAPLRVYASAARAPTQRARPPLLSQALVEYESGQAELFFDANTLFGEQDSTFVAGTRGSASSSGPDLNTQSVTLATAEGRARPVLSGSWFPDGFHGTMGELLRAVEEKREPMNSARNNLKSLELCFAAIASAVSRQPVVPGTVRRLQD